jgi:hypothetical protein
MAVQGQVLRRWHPPKEILVHWQQQNFYCGSFLLKYISFAISKDPTFVLTNNSKFWDMTQCEFV